MRGIKLFGLMRKGSVFQQKNKAAILRLISRTENIHIEKQPASEKTSFFPEIASFFSNLFISFPKCVN